MDLEVPGLDTVPMGSLRDFQRPFGLSTFLTFHFDLRTTPWKRQEAEATLSSGTALNMSCKTGEVGRIGAERL